MKRSYRTHRDREEQRLLSGRTPPSLLGLVSACSSHTEARHVGPAGLWGSTLEGLLCPWPRFPGSDEKTKEQREPSASSSGDCVPDKLYFYEKIHDTEAREPRIGLGLHRETNSRGF